MRAHLGLLLLVSVCVPVFVEAEYPWHALVREHCPDLGVPAVVAEAIIRQESRGNPFALNVNGTSHFSTSQSEATIRLHEALQETRNVDIGLMQINWRTWGRVIQVDPALLLDPSVNIAIGCTLLGGYITMEGDIVRGMLRYHSATPQHQRTYLLRMSRTLATMQAARR